MRRSRSVLDAVLTAAAAAFSHDSVLVPTNSITLYTLSGMMKLLSCGSRSDHRRVACGWEDAVRGAPGSRQQPRLGSGMTDAASFRDRYGPAAVIAGAAAGLGAE